MCCLFVIFSEIIWEERRRRVPGVNADVATDNDMCGLNVYIFNYDDDQWWLTGPLLPGT